MPRMRRGESIYKKEMARMIDQYRPGSVVLCTYQVIGDSLVGVVERVNKVENKVYVAWNGGPVKQHDPDEIMLAERPVSPGKEIKKRDQVVKQTAEQPAIKTARRMSGNKEENDIVAIDPNDVETHSGGFDIVQNLIKEHKKRFALYHGQRGRYYRRTRRERDDNVCVCPRCKIEMEGQPFTKGIKLYSCPECGFKIPADKLI